MKGRYAHFLSVLLSVCTAIPSVPPVKGPWSIPEVAGWQQAFLSNLSSQPAQSIENGPASISLSTNWTVLGPFPAGMRELPLGGYPAAVQGSYASLFGESLNATFHSAYGPVNGATQRKQVLANATQNLPFRVEQKLEVGYPEVDWAFIRRSVGWSALQWQMVACSDLEISINSTCSGDAECSGNEAASQALLALTMDKVAEFAIIPKEAFTAASEHPNMEWHNGDWYSYLQAASKPPNTTLPISQHLLSLRVGSYKLLVRSMYEIRIFKDPGEGDPKLKLGIKVETQQTEAPRALEVLHSSLYSNVPDVVGGWLAGWGLSFGIRNLGKSKWYRLEEVKVADVFAPFLYLVLDHTVRLAPLQTRSVPLRIVQKRSIPPDVDAIDMELIYSTFTLDSQGELSTVEKGTLSLTFNMTHKASFYDTTGSGLTDAGFLFSYLGADQTLQVAVAKPPKRPSQEDQDAKGKDTQPPLIVALHGAGVDIRDFGFLNSFDQAEESWIVMPSGRNQWGYDWQLASLSVVDAAFGSFSKHIWGLPPSCEAGNTWTAGEVAPPDCMSNTQRMSWQPNPEKIFVVGHSNGGQGSWYRLSHFPDRAIGGIVAAAYTKVSDYVQFDWKVGRHFNDPSLTGILRSSISMFENDLHASNLAGLDLLVKYGAADKTVPPWNSRDMVALIEMWNTVSRTSGLIKTSEVPGKDHWWDTIFREQDVNDAIAAKCTREKNPGYEMPKLPSRFTLTVANPDEAGSKGGWSIVQVEIPGKLSRLTVELVDEEVRLKTANVQAIQVDTTIMRQRMAVEPKVPISIKINGKRQDPLALQFGLSSDKDTIAIIAKATGGSWTLQQSTDEEQILVKSRPIGPMIRIVSSAAPINIVLPSNCGPAECEAFDSVAHRFAADSLLYGGLDCNIVYDREVLEAIQSGKTSRMREGNMVVLGGPHLNLVAKRVIDEWPGHGVFRFPPSSSEFMIRSRHFWEPSTGLLMLGPHPFKPREAMALILHGTDLSGVERAARALAVRTATTIPEWIVLDESAEYAGEGGVQGAGWYTNDWQWSESISHLN